MPEYLAPGVYVEEVDTGAKPIEGVSTSTAGMVGVTERGPVDIPTLVTGTADFRRKFGWYLDRRVFTGDNWYLPHAVKGFFDNGGKRLYVVRVLPITNGAPGATVAEALLFDRGAAAGVSTRLAAGALSGHTALVLESATAIDDLDWLRVDDDGFTEYVQADTTPTLADRGVRALRSPLYNNHAAGASTPIVVVTMTTVAGPGPANLDADVAAGETRITLDSRTNVDPDDVLDIGTGPTREFAVVASVPDDPADLSVTLRHPLAFNHDGTVTPEAAVLTAETASFAATQLNQNANAGMAVIIGDDLGVGSADFDPGDVVRIGDTGDDDREFHVVAALRNPGVGRIPIALRLRTPAYADHSVTEPVQVVTLPDAVGLAAFDQQLSAIAQPGDLTIRLIDRGDLAADDRLRIGAGVNQEFAVIENVPTEPTDLSVTLTQPLAFQHTTDHVVRVTRTPGANSSTMVQSLRRGQSLLMLADATGFVANTIVEIGAEASPVVEYQTLGNLVDLGLIGVTGLVGATATAGVVNDHAHGVGVFERGEILRVQAIDLGGWGNSLQARVEDDTPILRATARSNPNPADVQLTLSSTVGIEPGTVLEIDFSSGTAQRKVVGVTGNVVTLGSSHTVAILAGTGVRTREFRLTVDYVQINPMTSKARVIDSESHRQLSMDPRHSRYVTKVIGAIFRTDATTPRRADGRTEGESDLIRVEDALADETTGTLSVSARTQAENNIRLGSDLITDVLPDGRVVAVGIHLANGDDAIGQITDATYIGLDAIDPQDRRGLYALKNIEDIAIVAIPGRTNQQVQQELITHCELMRYRFAVLDSDDRIGVAEVQEQRGLYDTKYAALYYPWLRIIDPYPENPRVPGEISIPPSGHIIGIYARTDIERGVHKAPANEVIRAITNLESDLTKEEQDILNPQNINVLRNFRANNRALRVWGARTLSSDPDWKYINVRRLFIFVEHSIDRGTQWVVFEPNSEALWQRVIRAVSGFLTNVWRDGALMGRTKEEAYFVKCDRTTMTQADIDNGRLIVQVGIAPVKPAEFVIFRIGQWAGGSELEEG